MKPELSWNSFCNDGFRPHWRDPRQRLGMAEQLVPWLITELLVRRPEEQLHLANTLTDIIWPQLIERHSGARAHGWPELMSAAAVALTLVVGELSSDARDYLHLHGLFAQYERKVMPYQRFLLAVGQEAVAFRVLLRASLALPLPSDRVRVPPEVEKAVGVRWRHGAAQAPSIAGRSHTALLALLVLEQEGRIVLPSDAPVAATGELDRNGQDLLPVSALDVKKAAWRRYFPDGWFITSPPGAELSAAKWARLLHAGHSSRLELPEDESKISRWNLPARTEVAVDRWLCAGSLDELADKLVHLPTVGALAGWDGAPILNEDALELRVREEYGTSRGRQRFTEVVKDDLFFNLCWSFQKGQAERELPPQEDAHISHSIRPLNHGPGLAPALRPPSLGVSAARGLHRPAPAKPPKPQQARRLLAQGAILYGGPGSGKSILLKQLMARFVSHSLGVLGLALYVSARALAEELRLISHEVTFIELLARIEPQRAGAIQRAHAQARLYILLDGLDEVGHAPLTQIGELLRSARTPFLATARPVHGPLDSFPTLLCFHIQPLNTEQVRSYLSAHGREDLTAQLTAPSRSAHMEVPAALKELCETPLALSLLCRMVRTNEPMHALHLTDLYQRAFEIMLDRATTERRLGVEQAAMLQRTAPKVLGDLAWTWVSGEDNYISDEQIRACLEEQNDIRGQDVHSYQLALERGSFIVPGSGRREFGHKTIAEWAASGAVVLRSERQAARLRERNEPIDWAAIEREIWEPLLRTSKDGISSRFKQVLLFFASRSHAPQALLHLVGWLGQKDTANRVISGIFSLGFAAEIAAQIPWRDAASAQWAWGFLVRQSLFGDRIKLSQIALDEADKESPQNLADVVALRANGYAPQYFATFAGRIGNQLPHQLDSLIRCVARSEAQRLQLTQDPTALLPYCTAAQGPIFFPLITTGTPDQLSKVLEFCNSEGVVVPEGVLDWLSLEIPRRISSVSEDEEPEVQYGSHGEPLRFPSANYGSGLVLPEELPEGEDRGPSDQDEALDDDDETNSAEAAARADCRRALEKSESALYAACAAQGYLLPLDVLRERLLGWPDHLQAQLEPIVELCVDCLSPVQLRDFLLQLMAWATSYGESVVQLYRDLAAQPDRDLRAHELYAAIYTQRAASQSRKERWEAFCDWARANAGWSPQNSSRVSSDVLLQAVSRQINDAVIQAAQAATAVKTFLLVIQKRPDFHQKIAAILEDLPNESQERRQIIAVLSKQGPIPDCASTNDLVGLDDLQLFEKPDRIPQVLSKPLQELWTSGVGFGKLCGLLYIAPTEEPERRNFLVSHLRSMPDPTLVGRLRSYLQSHYRWLSGQERIQLLSEQELQALPLEDRAQAGLAGWQEELLKLLEATEFATGEKQRELRCPLYNLVIKHKLTAAISLLRGHVLHAPPGLGHEALKAYTAAGGELDDDLVATILSWPSDQIPRTVLPHIKVGHLPALLGLDNPPGWTDDLRDFLIKRRDADALISLRLTEIARERGSLYQAEAERVAATATESPAVSRTAATHRVSDRLRSLRSWEQFLLSVVLWLREPDGISVEDMVELALREGQIEGWSCPPDQRPECAWNLTDYGTREHPYAAKLLALIKVKMSAAQTDAHALRRLFSHPAATVRDGALELLLSNAQGPQKAELLIAAISGLYAVNPQVDHSLDPFYGRPKELLNALRQRISPAHRRIISELTRHPLPILRAQAAKWIGSLGIANWLPLLIPCLEDEHSTVLKHALESWQVLARSAADVKILTDRDRSHYTEQHWSVLIGWLVRPHQWGRDDAGHQAQAPHDRDPLIRLSISSLDFLDRVIVDRLDMLDCHPGSEPTSREATTRLQHWELLLARVDFSWAKRSSSPLKRIDVLLSPSLLARSRSAVSEELRSTLLRALLRRGECELVRAEAERLLEREQLLDRILGAECHLRLGSADRVGEMESVWREACLAFKGSSTTLFSQTLGSRLANALLCADQAHHSLLKMLHVVIRRATYKDDTTPYYLTAVGRQQCDSIRALRVLWRLPAREDEEPEPEDDGPDVYEDYGGSDSDD